MLVIVKVCQSSHLLIVERIKFHFHFGIKVKCLPAFCHEGKLMFIAERSSSDQCQPAIPCRTHFLCKWYAKGIPLVMKFWGVKFIMHWMICRRFCQNRIFWCIHKHFSAVSALDTRPAFFIPVYFLNCRLTAKRTPAAWVDRTFIFVVPRSSTQTCIIPLTAGSLYESTMSLLLDLKFRRIKVCNKRIARLCLKTQRI